MLIVVVVAVICAIVYFKLKADPAWLKEAYKGKTPEQKAVMRYFLRGGCMPNIMSDEQYDSLVSRMATAQNFKQRALNKHGIDESQVQEIPPVFFEGYVYEDAFVKKGKDGLYRSSKYQLTWIFFSDSQVYFYQYTFNTNEASKNEMTDDYWYKDVVNFTSSSETVEFDVYNESTGEKAGVDTVNTSRFMLTVPGDKKIAAFEMNDENERIIKGMKNKLREKKS